MSFFIMPVNCTDLIHIYYINLQRRIRLLGTVGDQLAQKNVNIKISSAALMQFIILFQSATNLHALSNIIIQKIKIKYFLQLNDRVVIQKRVSKPVSYRN